MKPLMAEVTLDWLLGRIYPEDSVGEGGQAGDDTGGGCQVGGDSGDSAAGHHLLQT